MSIDSEILNPFLPEPVQDEDEGEWEDVPEANPAWDGRRLPMSPREGSVISNTPSTSRASRRRRKTAKAVVLVHSQTTMARRLAPVPPQKTREKDFELNRDMVDAIVHSAATCVRYLGSVFSHALRLLKKPLGFILFVYLLGCLLGWLFVKVRSAFEPICWIPGISSTVFCRPPQIPQNVSAMAPQRVDYPRLVEIQSSSFEQLLDGSVGGPALSLDIKKAEMATRDLITLVKYSGLKSREHLAQSLADFVLDAKKAGKGLAKLTSRIDGAVDNVMAINDYALQTIEGAKAQEPHGLMRVLPWFGAEPPSRAAALDAFKKSMDVHTSELQRLILEVEVSSAHLDALDAHLDTLHEICTRENLDLGAARDALLANLWTILGGNRDQVRAFNMNLNLLRELGEYRRRASAHVAAASQTLQAMGEDMEDLRERVAAPELVGDRVPVEVHMKSIRAGIERLKEQRIRAKEREERLMNKILGLDS